MIDCMKEEEGDDDPDKPEILKNISIRTTSTLLCKADESMESVANQLLVISQHAEITGDKRDLSARNF